jgi:hypothetical protein
MLHKPSTDATECLRRARECELHAERVSDSAAKQSFLDLAARWRRIAETFEYIERVDRSISKPKGVRSASVGGPGGDSEN